MKITLTPIHKTIFKDCDKKIENPCCEDILVLNSRKIRSAVDIPWTFCPFCGKPITVVVNDPVILPIK